ncbi:unnamed protein product [Symbiodinium natans]|uniref:Uncharacterized protein n=1 Tax=Symbiodinium natans TaxID=878477 RepID=A0A812NWD8_9DINO|nr:unnamed protein product [Symbiodinium natans]
MSASASDSSSDSESEASQKRSRDKKKVPVWKCPRSYPQLHPSLEGHLYGRPSRMGPSRYDHAEMVVGSRSWYEANGNSFKRHALDAGRGQWVPHARGAVHGTPGGDFPRWPECNQQQSRRRKHGFATKAALILGKTRSSWDSFQDPKGPAKEESLLSLKGSRSLPDIVTGEVPYPPSPCFIRDYMQRACRQP